MAILRMKKFWVVAAVCAAGTVFQFASGCGNILVAEALTSFDFCKVFNCSSTGYFQFCNPAGGGLFMDCPTAPA